MIDLYNEDCLERLREMDEESIDLTVIDPPYKLTAGGKKDSIMRSGNGSFDADFMSKGTVFKNNKIKSEDWFKEIYRVMKNGTHFYVMCNDKYVQEYLNNAQKAGFKEVNILVWSKHTHTPTQYYLKNIEFILLFRKGGARYINTIGTKALIDIEGIRKGRVHPTEKPVELMELLIKNSTNEGDTVLDCFMGAGSTGIAAVKNNRNFIGIELDKKYYDIAKKRIEEAEEC